ncbi:MAG: apolipoprotein N-acyltransferase [Lewinellaceae bacterium]|nr:apolipoprotein N-acyltransferase [Lewinellaceae bacterium]
MKKPALLSIPIFLLAAFLAYRMFALSQVERLWGHLPLYFFASAWLGVVLAFFPKDPKHRKWLGLSTLTGLLLTLGFPPLPFTFLMFVAWIPLLWMQEEMKEEGNGRIFRYAYHAFIVWNILTTYWVTNAAFIAGLIAITANSALMAIPFVLFHWVRKYLPRLSYLILIAFWLSFEYIHLRWQLTWPWLTLGNAFSEYPSWVQWYEYTGVFGGTLWILVVNIMLIRRQYAWAGALMGIPLAASLAVYYTYQEKGNDAIEAVVVQPNFEPHYEIGNTPEREQLTRFIHLADSLVTPDTRYVFFPETSFGPIRDKDLGKEFFSGSLQTWVDQHPGLTLVTGLMLYHIFEPGETHTPYVREFERKGERIYYESYNAATQFTAGATEYPIYKKSKLVPGAESFPYSRYLSFLKPIVENFGGSVAGLGIQEKRTSLQGPQGIRVAPIICYESAFGEFHTGYIRAGAQVDAILTNDGWWDHTAGHKQHLRFASLRAIETRRDIARSANTGISAFIDQRGDILQPTGYEQTTAIRGTLRPNDQITFYVKWGDLIGRISLFLSVIFILNGIVKSISK